MEQTAVMEGLVKPAYWAEVPAVTLRLLQPFCVAARGEAVAKEEVVAEAGLGVEVEVDQVDTPPMAQARPARVAALVELGG